jgi:putative protein-disulfide isomerase
MSGSPSRSDPPLLAQQPRPDHTTPMTTTTTPRHLLYIADPMCSWCYGFAPVVEALADHFKERLPVRVMVGGLRAGNTRAMGDEDKTYIRNAWTKVSAATGRPFDHAFFEREGFVYDTEPACRAVVTARALEPQRALAFKGRISQAFYAANRDMTSTDEIVRVANEAGFDGAMFRAAFEQPDIRNETFRDFLTAKQMGVEGFPCLVAGSEADGYAMVTHGYRPLDGMIPAIEKWLASQHVEGTSP